MSGKKVLAAFDHHEYPFPLVVEKLRPPRDAARPPIFQTMFVMRRTQSSLEKGSQLPDVGRAGRRAWTLPG